MSDDRVLMRDPNSPDSPPYAAMPSQVPFLGAAGWVEVKDEPEQGQADDRESGGEKKASERPRATSAAKKKGDS